MIGEGNRTVPFEWLAARVASRQPEASHDRVEQERLIMESGLAWTIVKPPRLTDAAVVRPVEASPHLRVGMLSSVSRTNLARFIVDAIDREDLIGQRVFVRD